MVTRKWCRVLAAVMMAALVATVAVAQDQPERGQGRGRGPGGPGGPGGFGGRGGPISGPGLLAIEAVQKDLGLSAEAVEKAKALAEESSEAMREAMQSLFAGGQGGGGFRDMTDEQRRELQAKMADARKKAEEKIQPKLKEILTAEQQTRLQQIGYQIAGVGALSDPAVAKELGLSKEQSDKIASTTADFATKTRELMQGAFAQGGGGGGNFQEIRAKADELNKERDTKVAEILTTEQKAAFEKLKGKPFDVASIRGGFGGRGGPGGPGGAGGRPGGRPGGPNPAGRPGGAKKN